MIVSKVLLKDLITNHLKQENGLNEMLQITLNAMMKNERSLPLKQIIRRPISFIPNHLLPKNILSGGLCE